MKHLTPAVSMLVAALGMVTATHAQHAAHVHGLVRLDLVIEPGRLAVQLEAPQEALLGHERAPRSDAEKRAATALLARLREGPALWTLDAALGCTLQRSEVQAPMLDAGAKPGSVSGHAEVQATFEYACGGAPRQLDLGALLDAYPGVGRVESRIVGPQGQRKASLKRPARVLAWGR